MGLRGVRRQTRRKADGSGRALAQIQALEQGPQGLRARQRIFRRTAGQDQEELIPAVAESQIGAPELGEQDLAHCLQQAVAVLVATGIVVHFEVVQVDDGDTEAAALPIDGRHFAPKQFLQVAAIVQTGEGS